MRETFRLSPLPNRLALAEFCNDNGLTGYAAEVGVWLGYYSVPFLDRWKGECMYLIDPWDRLPADEYRDVRNDHFDAGDYGKVVQTFLRFGSRAVMCRMRSNDAAKIISDKLDFVYIDANHAYEHVRNDLSLWWDKLSDRAVLAGHDVFWVNHPGVTQALYEFACGIDAAVELIPGDKPGEAPSFFIRKGF